MLLLLKSGNAHVSSFDKVFLKQNIKVCYVLSIHSK